MKRLFTILTILCLSFTLFCGCKSNEGSELDQVTGGMSGDLNVGVPGDFGEFMEGEEEQQPSDQPEEQQPEEGEQETPEEGRPEEQPEQTPGEQTPQTPQQTPNEQTQPTVDYTTDDWITICSYNVKSLYYDHINFSNGTPMSKLEAVVAELKTIDADVVGLQELDRFNQNSGVQTDQLETLARMAGYPYCYYTKTIPSGAGEYGHGIMSRYPIKKSESFHFKDFSLDGQGSEPRAYSRSELQVGDKILVLYNTHLAGKQVEQMAHINKKMANDMQKGRYAVLTGDMNAYPKNLAPSISRGYCTMLNTVKNPLNTTYKESVTMERVNPIDNIVVTNNLEYYWDSYLNSGIIVVESSASDHLPIYTYVRMK